jgi:hypothetical protein
MPDTNPPTLIWPSRARPEVIVDEQGIFLVDPAYAMIGFDTNWGRDGPLSRIMYAGRSTTRDL